MHNPLWHVISWIGIKALKYSISETNFHRNLKFCRLSWQVDYIHQVTISQHAILKGLIERCNDSSNCQDAINPNHKCQVWMKPWRSRCTASMIDHTHLDCRKWCDMMIPVIRAFNLTFDAHCHLVLQSLRFGTVISLWLYCLWQNNFSRANKMGW